MFFIPDSTLTSIKSLQCTAKIKDLNGLYLPGHLGGLLGKGIEFECLPRICLWSFWFHRTHSIEYTRAYTYQCKGKATYKNSNSQIFFLMTYSDCVPIFTLVSSKAEFHRNISPICFTKSLFTFPPSWLDFFSCSRLVHTQHAKLLFLYLKCSDFASKCLPSGANPIKELD